MNLWQKALRCGLTPGNIVSYLSLQHMRFWGSALGTLRLRCKALALGVHIGHGVRAHGPVGLLRWPGSHIEIGDGVSIISSWRRSTACSLAAPARLRTFGPTARIAIGPACELSGTSIAVRSTSVTLGRQVLVGPNCVITDADFHALWPPEVRAGAPGTERDSPVRIDDYVWIGMNCHILKGVHIGRGAIIGAGSVVTRDIPPACLAAGNPASILRTLGDEERSPNAREA